MAFILATFTSSYAPGSGNTSAKLWVDDMEFIYNPSPVDISEALASNLRVYPNPTNDGNINLNLGGHFTDIQVIVTNMMGQTVSVHEFGGNDRVSMVLEQPNGMYFLTIRTKEGQTATVRVLKTM
jgi:hypothetical protein